MAAGKATARAEGEAAGRADARAAWEAPATPNPYLPGPHEVAMAWLIGWEVGFESVPEDERSQPVRGLY